MMAGHKLVYESGGWAGGNGKDRNKTDRGEKVRVSTPQQATPAHRASFGSSVRAPPRDSERARVRLSRQAATSRLQRMRAMDTCGSKLERSEPYVPSGSSPRPPWKYATWARVRARVRVRIGVRFRGQE